MADDKNSFGTFPRKWARILEGLHQDDDFIDKAQQCSHADLDKYIVECNEHIAEMKKNMDADQDLKDAKENVKAIAAQYTDSIKVNEAKAMYCVYIKNSL